MESPDWRPILLSNRRLLWSLLLRHWPNVLLANVLAVITAVATTVIVGLVGPSVEVMAHPDGRSVTWDALLGPTLGDAAHYFFQTDTLPTDHLLSALPWLLLAAASTKAIASLCQWFLWERTSELVARTARAELVAAFTEANPEARGHPPLESVEAALSSTVTTDVRLMREYIVHFYGGLPREALQSIFLATTLIALSPKLTLIFLVGVAPAAAVGTRIGRVLRRRASKALADYSELSEWLQQRLLGVETIKHYRTEAQESEQMRALSARMHERFLRAARARARTSPAMEGVAVLALAAVLTIALRDIANGTSTGAVQMSFFSSLALLSQAGNKLGRYIVSNRDGAAAMDRLRTAWLQLLNAKRPHVQLEAALDAGKTRLRCTELGLRYPDARSDALADFSFTFESGRIYCLAGPSGAGKSTLFNLMLGLARPSQGKLEIAVHGGRNDAPIAFMPQKVLLFPGTVADNVAYPDANPDYSRVEQALALVGLTDSSNILPDGIRTAVGEGGKGLSGGQSQRILLARLWYRQAPIALVDEGTSALDPETEQVIHQLLRRLTGAGALVIVIAHRRAVAEAADTVLLLDHGRLLESGTPAQVLDGKTWQAAFH